MDQMDVIWTTSASVLRHGAPPQTSRISSLAYSLDKSLRKIFMQAVLQHGMTKKAGSPEIGSTAPNAYRYSCMWWQGALGRLPPVQQYFGVYWFSQIPPHLETGFIQALFYQYLTLFHPIWIKFFWGSDFFVVCLLRMFRTRLLLCPSVPRWQHIDIEPRPVSLPSFLSNAALISFTVMIWPALAHQTASGFHSLPRCSYYDYCLHIWFGHTLQALMFKAAPHKWCGAINREFCVRTKRKNRRFTGYKSRFLQEADTQRFSSLPTADCRCLYQRLRRGTVKAHYRALPNCAVML